MGLSFWIPKSQKMSRINQLIEFDKTQSDLLEGNHRGNEKRGFRFALKETKWDLVSGNQNLKK